MNVLRIRNLELRDFKLLEEIHRENFDFDFPDLENELYFLRKTILENEVPIGAAFVRVTTEAVLILDPRRPKITRARAVKELLEVLEEEAPKFGVDETHCFVSGNLEESTIRTLKNLGFVECLGTPLVKEL